MAIARRNLMLGSAALGVSSLVRAGSRTGERVHSAVRGVRGFQRPRALVVVQLTGGNDGLGMVVPCTQDAYWRARPTLARPVSELQPLTDEFALHADMGPLRRQFDAGRLAVVHAVGYPRMSRSHFQSMEIWHSAVPDASAGATDVQLQRIRRRTEQGWMGALADRLSPRRPNAMVALHAGRGELPLALRGARTLPPTIQDPGGLSLADGGETWSAGRDRILGAADVLASRNLSFLRHAAADAYRAAERMSELTTKPSPVSYPEGELGRRLELAARLISGDFGTQLFHVELGGFDTHSRQAATHAALLGELARGLDAFQRDLLQAGVAQDVVTLVFSEFGRRVQENASRGTDHGQAGPVFLLGESVVGGLHGVAPDLENLENGDLPWSTDFRDIYATLEGDWLGAPGPVQRPTMNLIQ